jgi:hypothetical protein
MRGTIPHGVPYAAVWPTFLSGSIPRPYYPEPYSINPGIQTNSESYLRGALQPSLIPFRAAYTQYAEGLPIGDRGNRRG